MSTRGSKSSPVPTLTEAEMAVLLKYYDKDQDGILEPDEIVCLVLDYRNKKVVDPVVSKILAKFDVDKDGKLTAAEVQTLVEDIKLHHTNARYAAYSVAFARAFRYLAFTSDLGEALRPVVSARIVTATYAISVGYCVADVGYEAYKLHNRGYVSEKGHPTTMTQLVVERSVFQAIASIAVPFLVIHTTVDIGKHAAKKYNAPAFMKKWGPSTLGLMMVPLLPVLCDAPVEMALEWGFERYGPWATHAHGDPHVTSADKKKD